MNKIIEEIYKKHCEITGEENISFTLAIKADELLRQLDYYPNHIWNAEGKIIFEYRQHKRKLLIFVGNTMVYGRKYNSEKIIEEYMYLTVDSSNTVLDNFWE